MVEQRPGKGSRILGCGVAGLLVSFSFFFVNGTAPYGKLAKAYTLLDGHGIECSVCALAFAFLAYKFLDLGIQARHARSFRRLVGVVALVFGALNVGGANLAYHDTLMMTKSIAWFGMSTLCVLGYAIAFYVVAFFAFEAFDRLFPSDAEAPRERMSTRKFALCSFLAILACWSIWLVAYYPATVDFDSERQLCTFLGIWPKSNHDPWFSTCVLGSLFALGRTLANDNVGMFLYIAFRAVVMAAIYARLVTLLRQSGARRWVYLPVLLFFAITPVWGAYAKQPFKDTFAAALFCWYITQTCLLVRSAVEKDGLNPSTCVLYALSGLAVSLFRHNYFYVVTIVTIVLAIAFARRRVPVALVACLFVGTVGYLGFTYCITHFAGVASGSTTEALSIPFQQTARTVRDHDATLSQADKDAIARLLDYHTIGQAYDPVISDPVKNTANAQATGEDYLAYFRSWAGLLVAHPVAYLEATLAGTYGYYAFTLDGYPSGGLSNCGMVILDGINVDSVAGFDRYFDFSYLKACKTLRTALNRWYHWWHKLPILGLTDTIPLYTWLLVLLLLYARERRLGLLAIPAIAVAIGVLTCIASPVNGSFRYFAPIAAAMPALVLCYVSVADQRG